jgi:F-type H+-transporting ATPase subunit epsilon
MRVFHLKIVTPDGVRFDGNVQRIIARTSEGDTGILYGHTDYTAVIENGTIRILDENNNQQSIECSNGILTVKDNNATILASE